MSCPSAKRTRAAARCTVASARCGPGSMTRLSGRRLSRATRRPSRGSPREALAGDGGTHPRARTAPASGRATCPVAQPQRERTEPGRRTLLRRREASHELAVGREGRLFVVVVLGQPRVLEHARVAGLRVAQVEPAVSRTLYVPRKSWTACTMTRGRAAALPALPR